MESNLSMELEQFIALSDKKILWEEMFLFTEFEMLDQ